MLRFFDYVSKLSAPSTSENAREGSLVARSGLASASARQLSPTFLVVVHSACTLCVPSASFFEDR